MPQARSGGSRSTSRSKSGSGSSRSSSGRSQSKRSSSSSSSGSSSSRARSKSGSSSSRSSRSSSSRSGSATRSRSTRASSSAGGAEARVEAVAQRLRKLNERIIEAGKDAGETTLSSYEKALKAIANTIEKGPGSSDVDWISDLATAQAKFLRDMATTLTARARKALK